MQERPSARLLVLDPENRILLFHFVFDDGPLSGKDFWATPGGALEDGETFKDAASRELFEETGIDADVGEEVAQRDAVFVVPSGAQVIADERYFLVRVSDNTVNEDGQGASEAREMKEYRWWSLADIGSTSEIVFPERLIQLLESLPNH